MAIAHLIVISAWLAAAVAVNVPSCRCTNHTRPPSASSLPPPDPCNGVRCQHGGTCEADGDTFICLCAAGYEGQFCQDDFCAGVRCQHGGTCDREGESFRCLCKDGYEGQFCQDGIVLTSCEGVNCNRGECEEEGGVARCVCQDGTGVFCENDLCLSVTCGLGQRDPLTGQFSDCYVLDYVDEGEDPFQCECEEAFPNGRFCDQVFCEAFGFQSECSGNGECTGDRETNLLSDACICNDGFFGDLCIFGPCSNDLCQNGGSCVRVFGVFQGCRCRDGFEGDSCEIAICFGNSCVNGGTCEVEGDEFRCRCAEGFSGEFCEIDLSICFGVTCLNGGTCIGTSNYDAACLCLDDYSGDRCQFGPCLASQPPTFCQNGGSCLDDREKNLLLGCECTEGFTGAMCEVGPCPDDIVCENGGVCVIVNGDFTRCRCPIGVAGDRCEFAPCIGNPCQNGGTCAPVIGDPETFQCFCMSPFFGEFCEMEESS